MVNDDELQDALIPLGKSEVRPPSPALVDDLEQRLLDLHGTIDARRGPSVPARFRFTAAVAAPAVLVAGFAYVAATRSGEGTTQLSSATDTSVVLPDGSIVAATEGFDLPNGTLVITGPEGSASIDGVTIPQNSQAVIEDGTARLVSSTTTTHDRGLLTFNDRLPAGVEHAGYRVIALDRAGRVVGASPIVHI